MMDQAYQLFEKQQEERGINLNDVKKKLLDLKIETPSWGYGDSGTRFKVFQQEGVPRDPYEKLADAAQVHKYTGAAPSVAIHIPWDRVDDYSSLKNYANDLGLTIGAVNPNLFQDDDYKYGSVTNVHSKIRKKAVGQMIECIQIMREVGSKDLSLWFADGTNYPGQGNFRLRKKWMEESLTEVYRQLDEDHRMLIEYKFFEPAFYHTDLPDWGTAFNLSMKLGPKAQVLVDTGHHPLATNIEYIVSYLLEENRLGGFHFNSRKYADDDLIVAAHNPYELFLIFHQIVEALHDETKDVVQNAQSIAYMLDQCHNLEPKIPAMIRSITNVQTLYAKALLVNRNRLHQAQQEQNVLAAEHELRRAFDVDVTPLLYAIREEKGVPVDPVNAYLNSSYPQEIVKRGKGGASW
ncbi:L-rhamnose isomerase [Salirhabdus salicampi]|uniref:L-rhamnose isomerase n=1 Tax=Salirhabdus salicampi TaxID=476102 RepID=UPI0020C56A03|nr:L-rhamnose isomerase [Salirhabdus salicampi]MCP8615674.1 L-rhamnose isomerase [Salirhabdus salicampi]